MEGCETCYGETALQAIARGDGMNHGVGKEGSRPISDLDACENFAWRSYVADIIVAYGTGYWETMANRGGDRSHANGQ